MLDSVSGNVITNDVVACIKKKFKNLDLSFVKPNKANRFIEYSDTETFRDDLFKIIKEKSIEVSVFPLVGNSKIKWYSKSIEKGKVLVALLNSNEENGAYTFMGVSE